MRPRRPRYPHAGSAQPPWLQWTSPGPGVDLIHRPALDGGARLCSRLERSAAGGDVASPEYREAPGRAAADDAAGTCAGEAVSEHDEPSSSSDRIGRYRVIDKLAAGGMGVVYLAEDPELDRRIALKVVRVGMTLAGLVAEAQSMATLQHPNVVAVHDVG